MAAPNGTVWGSIAGDYCRLGIYVSPTYNLSADTFTVEVWFWSKYSCTDSNNNLYFDVLNSSGSASTNKGSVSISTTVDSGGGWSTSNQVKLKTYTFTYNRTQTEQTKYVYAKLSNIDRVGATMSVSTTFTVLQLNHWTVSYNANGGSGAPASQTKWYGSVLTLSSTKPTRTGYIFKGWATSASGGVVYAAGGQYGTDGSNITLYAVWSENKLTVNYYSNYATYATYQGNVVNVSASTNILVHTQDFHYDNSYSSALSNVQNQSYLYLARIGYTPTGYWGTSTNGGNLVYEDADYSTGQALAQALGKSLVSGNASVNVYPQWKINTYKFNYNANGGIGSIGSQNINWNSTFILSNNTFKREGYKFVGWNVYRHSDNTWFVIGQGWLTEDEILANGYEKKLYENQSELTFNNSWIDGDEYSISEYTLYAIWEISGVVYIDNGTTFEPYLAYIDNGTEWQLYLMYVDDGANWNIIS